MLRRALAVCLLACCAMVYVCGRGRGDAGDRVVLRLTNTVGGQITVLMVSWSEPGETIAYTDVEIAGGGKALEAGDYAFALARSGTERADALEGLTVTVSVADREGSTHTLDSLALPSAWGDTHEYELCREGGMYRLKECHRNGSGL